MADKDLVRSVGRSTKRMQSARDVLLPKTEPTTVVPSTQLVDYKTYLELARSRTGNPLTQQDFEDLAGSREVPKFYEQNNQLAAQRFEEEQAHEALKRKYESGDRIAKFNEELTGRLRRTQEDLVKIGQEDQDTAIDYRNIAQTAAAYLYAEGDSDDEVAARRFAAQIFAEHGSRLSPHLDATLKPGWLAENEDRINQILEETEPQGLDRVKELGAKALSAVINFPAVRLPLDTLQQLEQAWFHGATGFVRGVDPATPNAQRADLLKHSGSSFLRGAGSLATLGQGDIGIQPSRAITLGREVIPVDVDESGDANLREFLGLHPELGGTFGDIADLAGIILLDPTTYLSLGSRSASSLITKALSTSDDHVARKVGLQLANGAKLVDLDDVSQEAARAQFLKYQIDAVGTPRNAQLVRQSIRQSPANVLRTLRRELKDSEGLLDSLIQTRTDRMTRAAERGIYPAIRIGGRTIIPMRKLYNSLGLIDTAIAKDSSWALHLQSTADLSDTDELLSFIQKFKGQEMPDELREQVGNWSVLANRMADDPETWLDDLLQRTRGDLGEELAGSTAAVDQAFDEIEAFGRELLGDGAVSSWRPWYETQWRRQFVDETPRPTVPTGTPTQGSGSLVHDFDEIIPPGGPEDLQRQARDLYSDEALGGVGNLDLAADVARKQRGLDPLLERRGGPVSQGAEAARLGDELGANTRLSLNYQRAQEATNGMSLRRAVDSLDPEDLSMEARAKIERNLIVFDEPLKWMLKDEILPRGLRSVATRDTVIGNLLRRISDLGSPQAGVRRTGDLGEQGARDVKNLTAIERARRQLVTDHVNMLDLDRAGSSRLYRAATEEYDGDLDQFLNDILSRGPDDIAEAGARASAAGQDNVARLVQSLERIRRDIFDLSVGAGFDEEALLAMRGYLPRTFSEEAVERANRATMPGSATAREAKPFRDLGLARDSADVGFRPNPLDQGGHARGRSFQRDLQDLYQVNDKAREQLRQAGLDGLDGFNLYEDNPIRAMLLRSREAHEAYAWMDMVKGMTDLTDLDGRPLAYMARTADDIPSAGVRMTADDATFAKKPANYLPRELPNGGRYWVREEILGEIERVNTIMRDPAALNGFQRFLTKWNDMWGAWATVPLVGTAFHMRNAAGNMFNMMLAGVKNPAVLSDAFRLQRLNRKATLLMRSDGLQYTEALQRAGADQGTVDLLVDARKFGVLGAGQTSDIFTATDNLAGRGGRGVVLNPLDQRNIVLQQGRAFGQAVENNARLGLFIDSKTAKGMNSEDAAENVRKFLFDYGDLTAFESGTMRMLSRFYTFARKNTALQVRMLMTQPGKVHNAQRITDEFTNQVMGGLGFDSEGRPEPGINEAGERIPDWVQPTLGVFRDSEGGLAIAGIDSPLGAAADVVDNLTAILKIPPALALQLTADGEFEKEQRGDLLREQFGDALSLFSGGPVEGVKTLFEFRTGEDLFTGGSLSDVDRNWLDSLFRITDTVVPVLGKIDREAEYLGGYEALGILQDEDRPDRNQGALRLMNTLLGMTLLPNLSDQDQITRNLNSLSYELNRSLDDIEQDLEDSGVEPLKFEDLQKSGDAYYHDKAFEFILYNTLEGTPLTAEQRQELNRIAPAEILEAAGVNVPESERAAWDLQEKARRIREISTVLQANGVGVTDEMIDAILLRESGARISDVKGLGIEPSFTSNAFLEGGDPEEAERLRKEQSIQQLTALSELFGVSIQGLQQRYPLMQEAERIASQMRSAGRTDNEIVAEITEKLSRQERALLFGEGTLDTEFSYSELTPDEVIAFQQKAAKADAELRVILQIVSGRQPTQYELDEWLSEVLFLVPEQEKLGFENYRPPSRENVTPDAVYDRRLSQKVDAVQQSTDFLSGV